jgi:hypothetical protein
VQTIFVDIVISPHFAQASERDRGAYGGIAMSTSFVEKTSQSGLERRSLDLSIFWRHYSFWLAVSEEMALSSRLNSSLNSPPYR